MKGKAVNIGIILSGGIGSRFGSAVPKQYIPINGKELIEYTIRQFQASKAMDCFIVVVGHDDYISRKLENNYGVRTVEGGSVRAKSFQNALTYIHEHFPDCEKVLFHEAARPLVRAEIFDHYFHLLDEYDYVESCKRITDSLGSFLPIVPKREDYYTIQAPEAYRFKLLTQYFDVNSDIYYAAHQLPSWAKGYLFFDIPNNFKLTYPEDIDLISYFLQKTQENL